MAKNTKFHPDGQVRKSQMLSTYGPGAMVDLPENAVMISGLDSWKGERRRIFEDRLEAKVCRVLEVSQIELYEPPVDEQGPKAENRWVKAWEFPEWFVANYDVQRGRRNEIRSRPLIHKKALINGKYLSPDKTKKSVQPIRFVQACSNGHISDVDWYRFVHGMDNDCRQQLWLDEKGTGGEFADIYIRCECGKIKSLASALSKDEAAPLGFCNGKMPWLGAKSWEKCRKDPKDEQSKSLPNKLLTRAASNAYFSQTLSVIHIPDKAAKLKAAVDRVYDDFLKYCENFEDLKREYKKDKVKIALEGWSLERVWEEVERRLHGSSETGAKIKELELETLLDCPEELTEDITEIDFFARTFPLPESDNPIMSMLDKVVLVHRLREVIAQVGFTRFEPVDTDIDGELSLDVRIAPLAYETTWVPAVENNGEGFFLSFKWDEIQKWASRKEVKERAKELLHGFDAWKASQKGSEMEFPGAAYIMLHSFAHLLITAVSLECGYSASSIKERIYLSDNACGILLYTGSPDAEGTLGGLVDVGRHIENHIQAALNLGKLCSNDPVCAQHRPTDKYQERFLNGAACHGCLLISETCCERQNTYLDRALVVPSVENLGAEFFRTDK